MNRKATNISLDPILLNEAKSLGINISKASEDGVQRAISKLKAAQWKEENAAALESSNEWVERNGLPLDNFRKF